MEWDLKFKRNGMKLDCLILFDIFIFYFFNIIFSHILLLSFSLLSSNSSPKNRAMPLRRQMAGIIFLCIHLHLLPLYLNTNAFFLSGGPETDPLNIALPPSSHSHPHRQI
uniref:Transmembrane protein n=1 Tax=Opuntia streptacantha TaxID=393608 RepID=A0A7C9D100_OPUST